MYFESNLLTLHKKIYNNSKFSRNFRKFRKMEEKKFKKFQKKLKKKIKKKKQKKLIKKNHISTGFWHWIFHWILDWMITGFYLGAGLIRFYLGSTRFTYLACNNMYVMYILL